jgi:CHAD domain-containing protein
MKHPTKKEDGLSPAIVSERKTALSAALRLLHVQYAIITENAEDITLGKDSLPLHDFRVAVRRLRALLKIFKRPLAGASASRLYREYSWFCSKLGPFRDADVWLDFLKSAGLRPGADRAALAAFIRREEQERRKRTITLRRLFSGSRWRILCRETEILLRKGPPRPWPPEAREKARSFAALRLKRWRRRLSSAIAPGEGAPPEEIHELRKTCRKARYCAEFFAPFLGGTVREMARLLKNITSSLGALHDISSHEQSLAGSKNRAAPGLRRLLKKRREKAWKAFKTNWRALHRGKFV